MKGEKVILYNTAYQVIGKGITAFFGVVMTYLMTRYLGASGFGQYNFVLAFVGIAYILADLGFDPILIRTSADKTLTSRDFWSLFTFRLIVLGILLIGTSIASKYYFHYSAFTTLGIAIAGLAHIFLMLSSMIWDLLRGTLEYNKIVLIQIFTTLIHCVCVWYAVYAALPPIAFFCVLLAGYLGGFVLSVKLSPFTFRWQMHIPSIKKYLVMAIPFMLGVAVSIASSRINILMLGTTYSPSAYPYVGYYSLGMRIFDVVILMGGYYASTLYPFFSQRKGAGVQKHEFVRYLKYALGIALCVTVGMYLAAQPFVSILAGPSFAPAIQIVQILAFAAGVSIIEGFFNSYLLAMGKEKIWVIVSVLTVFLNIILNKAFIAVHTYLAVSWITVVTHTFALILSICMLLWMSLRHEKTHTSAA